MSQHRYRQPKIKREHTIIEGEGVLSRLASLGLVARAKSQEADRDAGAGGGAPGRRRRRRPKGRRRPGAWEEVLERHRRLLELERALLAASEPPYGSIEPGDTR